MRKVLLLCVPLFLFTSFSFKTGKIADYRDKFIGKYAGTDKCSYTYSRAIPSIDRADNNVSNDFEMQISKDSTNKTGLVLFFTSVRKDAGAFGVSRKLFLEACTPIKALKKPGCAFNIKKMVSEFGWIDGISKYKLGGKNWEGCSSNGDLAFSYKGERYETINNVKYKIPFSGSLYSGKVYEDIQEVPPVK